MNFSAGQLRVAIDAALDSDNQGAASAFLYEFWQKERGPAAAAFALPRLERLLSYIDPVSCRLAILRSFTIEPVVPVLRTEALLRGINLEIYLGEFNTHAQELLNPSSRLYEFDPDIVLLAVQTQDALPSLWKGWADLSAKESEKALKRIIEDFRGWLQAYRSRCQSPMIIHDLETPDFPANGILDTQSICGQFESIRSINRQLLSLAGEYSGIYLLDYNALIGRHGRNLWMDEEKWLTARMPISADSLVFLAEEWLRFIHPLVGKICKALAVDLDNTLWGGVLGEEGIDGIKLGLEYPGAAYHYLQRAILDIHRRGVILAICSKNNPGEALRALEEHPAMLLRPEHFAALRINWRDKDENLREIARELNIGIDSLAFLDDSPVERQLIKTRLPEVTVIDLPSEPLRYAGVLRSHPAFERLEVSEEDRKRGRYYADQRLRSDLAKRTPSLEDFYRSLEMEAEIAPPDFATTARIAQLTQKTNQFNLTTRRYSEEQIREMSGNPACRIYSIRVRDRFGDNGIVGVAIVYQKQDIAEIDTFLLSCRVIGRTVESALLAALAEQARQAGAKRLQGCFIPTPKNEPCRDFYSRHGFQLVEERKGTSIWEFDLETVRITSPPWIKISPARKEIRNDS